MSSSSSYRASSRASVTSTPSGRKSKAETKKEPPKIDQEVLDLGFTSVFEAAFKNSLKDILDVKNAP